MTGCSARTTPSSHVCLFYCSACSIPSSHVCFFTVVPVPFREVVFANMTARSGTGTTVKQTNMTDRNGTGTTVKKQP
jgi:hypothetical protein